VTTTRQAGTHEHDAGSALEGRLRIGAWLGQTPVSRLVPARDRAIELLSTLEWRLN
jgi:hypothetical protein